MSKKLWEVFLINRKIGAAFTDAKTLIWDLRDEIRSAYMSMLGKGRGDSGEFVALQNAAIRISRAYCILEEMPQADSLILARNIVYREVQEEKISRAHRLGNAHAIFKAIQADLSMLLKETEGQLEAIPEDGNPIFLEQKKVLLETLVDSLESVGDDLSEVSLWRES